MNVFGHRWGILYSAAALAACGRVRFDLLGDDTPLPSDATLNGDGIPIDGAIDARPIDAALDAFDPSVCLGGSRPTDFPGTVSCGGWGGTSTQSGGMLVQNNGQVRAQVAANTAGTSAFCVNPTVPIGPSGEMLEVLQIANVDTIFAAGSFAMTTNTGTLAASSPMMPIVTTKPYNATQHRFWRIRPIGASTIYETAPAAGTPWTMFAMVNEAMPSAVVMNIGAQSTLANGTPGTAIFGSVDQCP